MNAVRIALALIWRDGQILIARRKPDAHLPNLWEFPGGKCRPTETLEACAVRETREELGIEVESLSCRQPFRFAYPDRRVELCPVDCVWRLGEPQPLECAECRWVDPAELAGFAFPPANETLIEELRREAGRAIGPSSTSGSQ